MSANMFTDQENERFDERVLKGCGASSQQRYGATPNTMNAVDPRTVNAEGYSMLGDGDLYGRMDDEAILVDSIRNLSDKDMALFEEDPQQRPFVSHIINRLANYEGGIVPSVTDPDAPKYTQRKLGTMMGVYFPCIQNIFGIILFIRFTWVIGAAGWLETFGMVLLCCTCALVTSISMSAIATNGVVASGGSYFMISRALGPEFGGAVGILFYLGTTVAASMYIVGAVEILLKYIVPQAAEFLGDISIPHIAFNYYRIYGTALFLLMFLAVVFGVRFVSKFSVLVLFGVIISLICVYIGIFVANPSRGPEICMVGERILAKKAIFYNTTSKAYECNNITMIDTFCGIEKNGTRPEETSPDCVYFKANGAAYKAGIPGLASDAFSKNTWHKYTSKGQRIGLEEPGNTKTDVIADISSSFVILIGILFPIATGFMSGSNRSGDLSDAQKSIPAGTIAAVVTTFIMYITYVFFIGAVVDGQLLRDKFGESIGGGLIIAHIAWPTPWIVVVGAFLSTFGAALQSLVGAPRLLQAIAADGVIPFINIFGVNSKSGEPVRALLLTALLAEAGILIANVDFIAPIISEFFLMCYLFVNLACALQTLLHSPNWRPRFRYYHWLLSLFGVVLCIVLMFLTSWYYALIAICIAAGIYKYIEYKGAEKEWGDGFRGLAMSAARYALLRLEDGPPHVKNWRPQILILLKLKETLEPKYRKMLTFSSQLKEGKGLTLVGSVLEGEYSERYADAQAAKQTIFQLMKKERARGFAEVIVADNTTQGLSYLIQGSGVGGLTHNTVMLGWPTGWRHDTDERSYKVFLDTLRCINNGQLAALIAKGIEQFPENTDKLMGSIDIWWIVHDGGLLMLLPFLLTQHKVWKLCTMRIFTVAQMDDNVENIKRDLQTFLYHLRLPAEVYVVPLPDSAIRAYTYERALIMEQRAAMMREMRLKAKRLNKMPQRIVDEAAGASAVSAESVSADIRRDSVPSETQSKKKMSVGEDKSVGEGKHSAGEGDAKSSSSAADMWSEVMEEDFSEEILTIKPDQQNIRRMHTAVRLNEVIVEKSHDARLVILNLPPPPKSPSGDENYMEYLEVLTEGIDRVLMVRGGGREVITIYL